MNRLQWMRAACLAGFAIAAGLGADAALAYTAPYSTPSGITLVDVVSGAGTPVPKLLWRRLGDANGNPLYTDDADPAGKSSCYGECAKEFPPLVADAHAKASGDFSILLREDRVRQWVYQGKPLYRHSGKDPLGEPTRGDNPYRRPDDVASLDPASTTYYSPKQGWRRAAYTPEKTIAMPGDFKLDALAIASGFGLVDSSTHLTVYAAPVSHQLSSEWRPLRASALTRPVGEFSMVERKNYGTRQWTYKGEALYTYAGDYAPAEVTGIFTGDKNIHAALIYRNFLPPGVQVGFYVGRGPLMTTTKGLTLYYVARFIGAQGGRDTRGGGYGMTYNDAKSQGAEACQGECTQSWKPLLAGAKAQASGFWEVVVRPDGARQWAFKGSPVYTFIGDRELGDTAGNNRSVIVFGGSNGPVFTHAEADPHYPQPLVGKIDMDLAVGPARIANYGEGNKIYLCPTMACGGAGFYWHTVGLFY